MTIGLTYDPTLSRVQIALSDLPDGTVQVQRVINPAATEALWARGVVRGGPALPVVGGVGALDDFEFAADVENHYRTVPVDPPSGLLLDGTSGNFASTPDDPGLEITGDVVLRAEVTLRDYGPVQQGLVAKWDSSIDERSYLLFLTSGGNLRLQWSENGLNAVSETSSEPLSAVAVNGERIAIAGWLDVDLSGGGTEHRVTFWTAPTMDGPWTQLGGAQDDVGVVGPLHDGTAALTVGAFNAGTSSVADGVIHRAQVWAGTLSGGDLHTGTMLADVDFDAQPVGTTAFDDAQGNTWTVNGTATITGIEQASITPSLDGQVWLKSIRHPFLNRPVNILNWSEIGRGGRSGLSDIAGRSVPVGSHELAASRGFTLDLVTDDLYDPAADGEAQAGEWDIIFASGGTFFLHVPADQPIPGGYVSIGDTSLDRIVRSGRQPYVLSLTCRIEAPPAPQVTGTLLTAETVFRLYGDATALHAAHSTGRSLLQTIGDPSDVVVL